MTTTATRDNLYLIEYYTTTGDIQFAWVDAPDRQTAEFRLAHGRSGTDFRGMKIKFHQTIKIDQQAGIFPLNMKQIPIFLANPR